MPDILRRHAAEYGVRLREEQLAQFDAYLRLLADWSERVNLVGSADPEVVQRRHMLESIAIGAALREREALRPDSAAIDVGAGAGFPGVPIKIAWPGVRLTLLEATAKKAAFLRTLVAALALDETEVVTGRAEVLAHDPRLRERFDVVLARAVAPLAALLELTLPFARVGGRVAAPKGSRVDAELGAAKAALDTLGGRAFVMPLHLPGPKQTLVIVAKQRETPPAYPRRAGVPRKSPIRT
jgi:16S rRNA (guanine527-N7)-methyltransferase